jgi:TolA-binding protein
MNVRLLGASGLLCVLFLPLIGQPAGSQNADFKLAVNLYNDKLYDLALEQFQQFINRYPASPQIPEAKFHLGLTQSKLGMHDEARFTFQNFALSYTDNPRAPEAWWNVAESHLAVNNFREAGVAFERVRVFHPRSTIAAEALVRAAECFEKGDDRAGARRALRTVIQEYGSSKALPAARVMFAELALAEGQYESARTEAQRVIVAAPNAAEKARAQRVVAEALIGLGRHPEAITQLNELLKTGTSAPGYHEALNSLGRLHWSLGSVLEAVNAWTTLANDTGRANAAIRQQALMNIGRVHSEAGEYGIALPFFERAASIQSPTTTEAIYAAAVAAEKSNQPAKAGEYFIKAYRARDEHTNDRKFLAGAFKGFMHQKNYSEAIRIALRFRDRFPDDGVTPQVLYEAARVQLHHLNNPTEAADLYQAILSSFPNSPLVDDALVGLAIAHREAGNPERALRFYDELLRRFPASEHRAAAEESATMIRLFELKSKEAGLEKLSLLVGDVIAGRSKAELAFRLAEIYFHELKDYGRAAEQFRLSLKLDLESEKRPQAWLWIGKSYEHLAWKEMLGQGHRVAEFTEQALIAYDSVVQSGPLFEGVDDAIVSSFKLRVDAGISARRAAELAASMSRQYPTVRGWSSAMMVLGGLQEREGDVSGAIETYRSLLRRYPESDDAPEAMLKLGHALHRAGKPDSALAVWESLLSKHKNGAHGAEAAWNVGRLKSERLQLNDALRAFRLIEDSYGYTAYAAWLDEARGAAYLAAGDARSAVTHFERVLAQARDDVFVMPEVSAEVLFRIAVAYYKSGNTPSARDYFRLYLARAPSGEHAGEAYLSLGVMAREEKHFDLAARYLQEAGKLRSGTSDQPVRALTEAGDLFFHGDRFGDAIARYAEAAQTATNDSVKQYALSRIVVSYFRMNNPLEADKRGTEFVKAYPAAQRYAAEFELERGRYLMRQNDLDRARTVFENIEKRFARAPAVPEANYWLGRVFEMAGRPREATRAYESVVERFPQHPVSMRARLGLGNLYYNSEQWDPAARQYRAILDNEQLAPDIIPFAMSNLILAYKELGLFDGALQMTRSYIERYPDDPELMNKRIDIGVLYQKLGFHDQSALHLQALLDDADAEFESEIRYFIGEALYYKGDYQQAILEFLKIPYLVSRKSTVDWVATSFYMAGQSYEKLAKYDQALTMYRQILDRSGIDATFKAAAQKEIDRVNSLVKPQN